MPRPGRFARLRRLQAALPNGLLFGSLRTRSVLRSRAVFSSVDAPPDMPPPSTLRCIHLEGLLSRLTFLGEALAIGPMRGRESTIAHSRSRRTIALGHAGARPVVTREKGVRIWMV